MKGKASVAALAAIVAAATAFASTAASGVKHVADVACGVPITTDITLHSDLICTGDGLEIESPTPIVVNLNGHTVRGSGAGTGVVFAGNATVKNGTIRGFATGVNVFDVANLSRMTITRNGTGVTALDDVGLSIAESTVSGNTADGIDGTGNFLSPGLTIRATTVAHNGGYGIHFGFGEPWSVTGSVLNGNGKDGLFSDDSTGQITDSVASYNRGSGIDIHDDYGGFFPYLVQNDTAIGNGEWGMILDIGVPEGTDGGGNVARDNGQPAQCLNVVCAA